MFAWAVVFIAMAVICSCGWVALFSKPGDLDKAMDEHGLWLFVVHLAVFVISGALVSKYGDYSGWLSYLVLAMFVLLSKYGVYKYWRKDVV